MIYPLKCERGGRVLGIDEVASHELKKIVGPPSP